MGEIRSHQPVKLMASLLTGQLNLLPAVEQALEQHLGPIDYRSPLLPFDTTSYYADEFGPCLQRVIVTFERLCAAASLAGAKRLTNELEQRWAPDGRRQVNIDPGYIALGKFVLATTKDQSHRIDVGQGIFAEVTLRYRHGTFETWEWTYPDYRSAPYIALFNQLRRAYQLQLKAATSVETPGAGAESGTHGQGIEGRRHDESR
jgi:hypothetical protein